MNKMAKGKAWVPAAGVLNRAVFFPVRQTYTTMTGGQLMIDEKPVGPLSTVPSPVGLLQKGINSPYGEMRNPVAMLERLDQMRPSNRIY